MMKRQSLLALTFLASMLVTGLAQAQSVERSTDNSVVCDEDACVYKVMNKAQSAIPTLIRDVSEMTLGNGFLNPDEDNIVKNIRGTEIYIKFSDPKRRAKYIANLKKMDVLDDMANSAPEIEISMKVYAMETSKFNNFQLGLANAAPALGSKPATSVPRVSFSQSITDLAASAFQLNLGGLATSMFSLFFDMNRINSWSLESEGRVDRVTNGETLLGSKRKPIYNKEVSTSTQTEKGDTGFQYSGKVSIDRLGAQLTITNFNLKYTSPTKEANTIFKESLVSRPTLQFLMDKPYVLFRETMQLDSNSRGNNFVFSASDSKNSINTTLVVILTAHLVNGPVVDVEKARNDLIPKSLSSNPGQSVADSLNSAKGYVQGVADEDFGKALFGQIVGFSVNPATITIENAAKIVTVKETNTVSKKTNVSYVQLKDLASDIGYKFSTLNFEQMQAGCQKKDDGCKSVPIEIEMKERDGSAAAVNFSMVYYPELKAVEIRPGHAEAPLQQFFHRAGKE